MHLETAGALAAFALLVTPSAAHTWIEQMMIISSNGSFTGNPGYCRNNTQRTAPGFSDPVMVHILPKAGQPSIEERDTESHFNDTAGITQTDPMCKKTQQTQYQTEGSPRLSAAPGDMIALRYQENGHVTLPNNQPGKPANRGTVYIYGTTQPKADESFLDVFDQWNADGSGGDKRGILLATQNFDDGRCYQPNSGNISTARQQQYPHEANQLMGASLWCQNDIRLPSNAPSGHPYTLYWVWNWPTVPGVDPDLPNGKAEVYTTCMDIDIQGASSKSKRFDDIEARQASAGMDINNAAIPLYVSSMKLAVAASTPVASSSPTSQPSQTPTFASTTTDIAATATTTVSVMNSDQAELNKITSELGVFATFMAGASSAALKSQGSQPAAVMVVLPTAPNGAQAQEISASPTMSPSGAGGSNLQALASEVIGVPGLASVVVSQLAAQGASPHDAPSTSEINEDTSSTSMAAPVATSASSGPQGSPSPASSPSPNMQPPSSLNIVAPSTGVAPSGVAAPSGMIGSSTYTVSSSLGTFTGTATPAMAASSSVAQSAAGYQPSGTGSVSQGGCSPNPAKKAKRSRIFKG